MAKIKSRAPWEAVNLRIPSADLARLDLLLAEFRERTGVFLGRSGALRALINWLEQTGTGIRGIETATDLERRLTRILARRPPSEFAPDRARHGRPLRDSEIFFAGFESRED